MRIPDRGPSIYVPVDDTANPRESRVPDTGLDKPWISKPSMSGVQSAVTDLQAAQTEQNSAGTSLSRQEHADEQVRFVVLQKSETGGTPLVKEYRACLDPNLMYDDGMRDLFERLHEN